MSKLVWITLGTMAATGGAIAGASYVYRRQHGAVADDGPVDGPVGEVPPAGAPAPGSPDPAILTPLAWDGAAGLPVAANVKGDLNRNWGRTPLDLRPLLLAAEEASQISGAARLLAIIGYRESRFEPDAHNGDAATEQRERDASWTAYTQNKARNPPLAFGEAAGKFGSGGLFGALAPYFLWTGVPEVGKKAPLLNAPPELLFQPRAAAFGAAVYMQRLLAHYRVDDIADIKVGWANPGLLGSGRGSPTYHDVRARFLADAQTLGIDLTDAATIPPKLNASAWPGVPAVFANLVGALPTELT